MSGDRQPAHFLLDMPADENGGEGSATPETESPRGTGSADLAGTDALRLLREARYYLDVLETGYTEARNGEASAGQTLRRRRVELGIDLPELDVVGMWASVNENGQVTVPFAGFLAGRAYGCLDRLLQFLDSNGQMKDAAAWRNRLARHHEELLRHFPDIGDGGAYPILKDRFVNVNVLEPWCTEGGEVRRCLALCRRAVLARTSR